jgi:hypothetical protein
VQRRPWPVADHDPTIDSALFSVVGTESGTNEFRGPAT